MSAAEVAVCGLGRMGTALAEALARAGTAPVTWNRTPRPGAAASPAEAARGARIVVLVLFDAAASHDVLAQVREGAAPGTLVVNCATVAPGESRALADEAEAGGLRYVEAPLIGSVPKVREGGLRILAGGAPADVAEAGRVLRVWSRTGELRRTGPVGSATALKLVANLGLGLAAAGLREALAYGAALGVPRADVIATLAAGHLAPFVVAKGERLAREEYGHADFTVAALAKDLRLVASQTPGLPVAHAAAGLLARYAAADGGAGGELDVAALGAAPGTG
ncbi:NAD(P)-binding domain-containing protein [Streptomyces sp. NPDC047046]|uniref:NAD(P)-dependent oxidoreductase n=1 Tax=Streptomyces sp. NPDC047046 TaxID=3155378 RepID=UPI0033CED295